MSEFSNRTKDVAYVPQFRDVVQIGRHGQPMSVRKVFPISRTAIVVGIDARRFVVDWEDMINMKSEVAA